MLALQGLELIELPRGSRGEIHSPRSAFEHAIAHFLAPPRQHEGMDVEGVSDRLHLDPRQMAQLHGRQLEFNAVAMNLPEPWLTHATPPSAS